MADLQRAAELLRAWDKILILSHRSPDGDTLGCASALSRALIALGKSVQFRCADEIPEKYAYMFDGVDFGDFEPEKTVTVDVADKVLLGALDLSAVPSLTRETMPISSPPLSQVTI